MSKFYRKWRERISEFLKKSLSVMGLFICEPDINDLYMQIVSKYAFSFIFSTFSHLDILSNFDIIKLVCDGKSNENLY